MDDATLTAATLSMLALVFRTTALIVLGLVYWRLAQYAGVLRRPMRIHIGTLIMLLSWVWVASVGDLLRFFPHGTFLIEYGSRYIFVPNAVITVGLLQLYVRIPTRRRGR